MYNPFIETQIKKYFIQRFDMKKANPGWLLGTCPTCGKKLKFGLNIKQNRTNCFVCGNSNPLKVITEVEQLETRTQALNFIKAFESADYLEFFEKDQEDKGFKLEEGKVQLPEGYNIITMGSNLIAQCAQKTLRKRGFNLNNLALRGIGYVDKPGSRYMGYIIIPYYLAGELIYFTARKIFDLGPKFKNPTLEEASIGKSLLTYNADALALYKEIHLVESATNSLTLGPKALGIGGKKISNYQYSAILRSPVKIVNIFLDPDAFKEALQLGLELANHKKVRVIKMPDEKDVNDIGKKWALELKKETPIQKYQELLNRKFEYQCQNL